MIESKNKQKKRLYLAEEQYTRQVIKNQYNVSQNDITTPIINLKQTLLLWHRHIHKTEQQPT